MKKLTEILNLSKFASYKAMPYCQTFAAGGLSVRAFEYLKEGDYKNAIFHGITAGICGLVAYYFNKNSLKNKK